MIIWIVRGSPAHRRCPPELGVAVTIGVGTNDQDVVGTGEAQRLLDDDGLDGCRIRPRRDERHHPRDAWSPAIWPQPRDAAGSVPLTAPPSGAFGPFGPLRCPLLPGPDVLGEALDDVLRNRTLRHRLDHIRRGR